MKRTTSLPLVQLNKITETKESEYIRQNFTLSRDTLGRFEDVCHELDLKTDYVMELAIELFLFHNIKEEIANLQSQTKPDC